MNAAEYAHKQGLTLYFPSPDVDLHMLDWFLTIRDNGTFFDVFEPSLSILSNFMKFLQFPNHVLYFKDAEDKVLYASWSCPIGQGKALTGFWSDAALPRTKLFQLLRASHAYAFSFHTLLLGVTRNEKLLSYINRLGYNVIGPIPNLWDGVEDATLVSFTRDAFKSSKLFPQFYETRNPKEPTTKAGGAK